MKLKTKNVTFNSVNYNCIVYSSKAAYNVKYNNIVIHSVFQWFLLLFNRVIVSFEIRRNYRLDEINQLLTKHVFNDYYSPAAIILLIRVNEKTKTNSPM